MPVWSGVQTLQHPHRCQCAAGRHLHLRGAAWPGFDLPHRALLQTSGLTSTLQMIQTSGVPMTLFCPMGGNFRVACLPHCYPRHEIARPTQRCTVQILTVSLDSCSPRMPRPPADSAINAALAALRLTKKDLLGNVNLMTQV